MREVDWSVVVIVITIVIVVIVLRECS